MTDSIALLPCPFCGCVPDAMLSFDSDQGTKWGRVICPECASWGPEVRTDYKPLEHWRARAAAEWNKRAALSPAGSGLTANSEPVADYVQVRRDVFNFLNGAAPLEGLWFGDPQVDDKHRSRMFWWRGYLNNTSLPPPPSVDVGKLRELVAKLEREGKYGLADELEEALNAAGAKV